MIDKSKLKDYANKLMFDMNDSEYETLANEFEVFLKQFELIGKIENIENVEPMTFPYLKEDVTLRDDSISRVVDVDVAFSNCHGKKGDEIKVPRVVE
jgi:aspartyl/glutamyl-tRNA(Asn/Gln) amidotransferase C subunit